MNNTEIKDLMKRSGLRNYEVANLLGVTECTFCRWFHKELPPEKADRIEAAIRNEAKKRLSSI